MGTLLELTGAELAREVCAVGRSLWTADSARRARMLAAISRYEGRPIDSLDSWSSTTNIGGEIEDEKIRWNLCRTLVDTVTAKVAGSQQPKVVFVASSADWRTRRKGPKLQQAVEGVWAEQQGPYSDIWDLGCSIFRDAAVCGIGHIKTWSDCDAGEVVNDRTYPWELLVDPEDAKYGRPSNLFQVSDTTQARLIGLFPEHKEAILQAKSETDPLDAYLGPNTRVMPTSDHKVVKSLRVYEWWSLPQSNNKPGRHVMALGETLLIDEEWKASTFPFASLRWSREFAGWHGRNLIDDVSPIDDEMNDLLARVVRTVRLTGMARTYKHVDDTSADESNDDAVTVRFEGSVPPTTTSPTPIAPVHIQLIELLKGSAYEFSGINQMTATAQKQPGIEAASAIRLVSDIQSERFAIVWRAYQQMYVELARLAIDCLFALYKENPEFSVRWTGGEFLKTINWGDVADMTSDKYTVRIESAPSIKGTAADRMQGAQELFASGSLSADALMAVRNYMDLPGEMDRSSRQRNVIERYIDSWLDATPEQIDSNQLDDGTPLIRPPVRFMRLEDALLQVVDGYLQAELDGAPDENKDLFLRWIELADSEIQARMKRLAAIAAPPAPVPPGPPTPQGGPLA